MSDGSRDLPIGVGVRRSKRQLLGAIIRAPKGKRSARTICATFTGLNPSVNTKTSSAVQTEHGAWTAR